MSAQLAYLVDQGRTEWIVRLREELAEFETTISTFPQMGRERDRDGTRVLRKMGLPRAPFSVWYAYDEGEPDGPITLLQDADAVDPLVTEPVDLMPDEVEGVLQGLAVREHVPARGVPDLVRHPFFLH